MRQELGTECRRSPLCPRDHTLAEGEQAPYGQYITNLEGDSKWPSIFLYPDES